MALFKRSVLKEKGASDELIEFLMTESNRALAANYIPKSDVQEQINDAVAKAQLNAPAPNIKDSEDYKELQKEFDGYKRKIETSAELKKGGVKEKFLDNVYSMLNEKKPASEQLEAIREQYEEYFVPTEQPNTPQFGAQVKGQMPSGKTGKTFEDVWGLKKG